MRTGTENIRKAVILIALLMILFPLKGFSHKIYVFAWAENGMIHTETKFSSNKFVKNGKVVVRDMAGKIILTGKTSEKGEFSFKIPGNIHNSLLIETDAGMGHKGKWKIGIDEIIKAEDGKTDKTASKSSREHQVKGPSIAGIISGILIIFIFFFILKFNHKKKNKGR